VWTTNLAGRLWPDVIFASPTAQRWPYRSIGSLSHSSNKPRPAPLCIAASTPPPPNSDSLAAFTIASTLTVAREGGNQQWLREIRSLAYVPKKQFNFRVQLWIRFVLRHIFFLAIEKLIATADRVPPTCPMEATSLWFLSMSSAGWSFLCALTSCRSCILEWIYCVKQPQNSGCSEQEFCWRQVYSCHGSRNYNATGAACPFGNASFGYAACRALRKPPYLRFIASPPLEPPFRLHNRQAGSHTFLCRSWLMPIRVHVTESKGSICSSLATSSKNCRQVATVWLASSIVVGGIKMSLSHKEMH